MTTESLRKKRSAWHLSRCACEELGIVAVNETEHASAKLTSAVYDRMIAAARHQQSLAWKVAGGGAVLSFAAQWVLSRAKHSTLRIELSYDILLVIALGAAAVLVLLLKRLLAGLDHLSAAQPPVKSDASVAPHELPPAASVSAQPSDVGAEDDKSRPERTRMALYQWLGFAGAATLCVLFAGAHTTWASMSLSLYIVALAFLAGGFGTAATTAIFLRELLYRKAVDDSVGLAAWLRWSRPTVTAVEKAFAITGIVFALYSGKLATVALNRTALANIAAARGQLYQAEARLAALEGSSPELGGLYARLPESATEKELGEPVSSPTWVKRAETYWHDRLLATLAPIEDEVALSAMSGASSPLVRDTLPPAIASASDGHPRFLWYKDAVHREIETIVNKCRSVEELYNFVFPASELTIRTQSHVEQRCRAVLLMTSNHIIDVMDTMHSAFDYSQEQILRRNEYDTWAGYLKDMGPHPLLIVNFQNWIDQKYMSREFFADTNQRYEYHDDATQGLEERVRGMTEYAVWRHFLLDKVGNIEQVHISLRSYRTRTFGANLDPSEPPLPR